MGIKKLKDFFPDWYQHWLLSSLEIQIGTETESKYLEPLFNLNKNWLKENYDKEETVWNNEDVAKAYALYYMSINIPKLWMVLENSGDWSTKSIQSVSEYGCGPGTFLWAYLFYLKQTNPEALKSLHTIKGYDISEENLKIAQCLFSNLKKYPEFSHIKADFKLGEWQNFYEKDNSGLRIFGNSLVESSYDINTLGQSEFSDILVIEPGTNTHFQRLRKIRDFFVETGLYIHFPCTGGQHCPMPADNWCHFHVNRFILPFVQRMSNAAGRKNHRHNFSSFLFSKRKSENSSMWRTLSKTRKVKRTAIRYICNGEKVIEAILSRKERSGQNKDFISCESGCRCSCSSKLTNKRLKASDSFIKM